MQKIEQQKSGKINRQNVFDEKLYWFGVGGGGIDWLFYVSQILWGCGRPPVKREPVTEFWVKMASVVDVTKYGKG